MPTAIEHSRPRLLVLGSGFGGYSLISHLPRGAFDVTLVSPRNYFLFTPLLPSAAVGTVEPRSIVEPVRRRRREVRFVEATAEGVDWPARHVHCRSAITDESFDVEYDFLVVAVGARVADLGIDGVDRYALVLKDIGDARTIRRRLLEQLSAAEVPGLSPQEVDRRLSIVVCGEERPESSLPPRFETSSTRS